MFKRITLLAFAAFMISAPIVHAERNGDETSPLQLNVALPSTEKASAAETIVPLGVLGFTSCACGIAMIALSNRLLSASSFAGTLMLGVGVYLINMSSEAAARSCALAKDAEAIQE